MQPRATAWRARGVQTQQIQVGETTMSDFETWLVASEPSLHRLAALLTDDRHAAEDLVQVTLAKMFLVWDRLDRSEPVDAYARRVLLNEHRSVWRWRSRRPERVTDDPPETAVGAQDYDGARDDLWRLVVALPPRQRAVVVLRYYEQLSEAEIAEVLGISRGTVKSQASRALAALRRQSPDRGGDPR